MAKTTTNRRPPDPKNDRREGYKLAITMLRQLETSTDLCAECALDELRTEKTRPQDNVVLRYLHECRTRSPSAEAAFCAILSDFVSDCSEGFVPSAATYQTALKIRVPRRVSSAVENRRTWKSVQRITGNASPMPPGWGKKRGTAR
jgi:hypothetical protein